MPKLSELVSKKEALHHVTAAVPKSQTQLICGNEGKLNTKNGPISDLNRLLYYC